MKANDIKHSIIKCDPKLILNRLFIKNLNYKTNNMSTKQTIHNFVTIGTAQHRRKKDNDLGYVTCSKPASSVFLSNIDKIPTDLEERVSWIKEKAGGIATQFNSYKEIYERYRLFTDLLDDYNGNKSGFATRNFDKLKSLEFLTVTDEVLLWDNLIHLAVTDQSGLLSETIVSVLTINHIAIKIKEDGEIMQDEKKLARLEQVSLLIPGKILTLPKTVVKKNDEPEEVPYSKALADQLIIATQNRQIKELEEAKQAIERAIAEYGEAITQELDDHMKTVNDLIETERSGNGFVSDSSGIGFNTSSSSESSESSQPQSAFKNTGLGFLNAAQFANVPSVQNLTKIATSGNVSAAVKAEITSFTPTTTLNASFVQNSTNAKVASTFTKFSANAGLNLATIPGLIGQSINAKMKSMGQLMVASQKVVKIGNTAVSLPDKPTEDMFAVILKETSSESDKYALHITQYFKTKSSEAIKFNVTVTDPDSNTHVEANSTSDFANDHYTTFVLFEDGIEFDPTEFGSATGTVKLRNGKTISFNFADLKVDDVFMAKPNYGTGTLDEDDDSPELYGVSKIGIAIFRRVEQELKQYVLGEIADVQTAEAGSYKNRKVKYLNRKTKFSESSSLTAKEISSELSNSSSTTASEEAQKSSSDTSSKDSGFSAGVSGGFGPVSFSADAYMNTSSSSSSEESNRVALEQAKEVSQTLTEQLTTEVQKLRSVEIISEREETVEIGYDHTKATEDKTSIFRWVDKVLENKVVNYGKRLMYEFMIPEPALNFKASLQSPDAAPSDVILLEKPKSPKQLGLNSPNDITLQNYLIFASAYAAEIDEAPMSQLNVGKGESLSGSGDGLNGYHHMKSFDVTIPEGYECYQVSWSAGLTDVDGDTGWPEGTLDVGARGWKVWPQCIQNVHNADLWGSVVSETLPVSFRTKWAGAINVNVVAHCRPTDKLLNTWKLETFNSIQEAYERKAREFNASLENSDKEELNDFSVSSYIARALEKRELTRSGIEMITEPFKINTARNNYRPQSSNNIPKIKKTLEFERHASHVKFLEQAFEWNTMAYKFYPYYWADESKWHEMMNTTNKGDITFQAFLQSGMARAIVPVRPGFEKAVMFYMETGLIWNGQGYTLDHDDDLYLSITEELIEPEGEVEQTWESRIPTNFRVINSQDGPFGADGVLEL